MYFIVVEGLISKDRANQVYLRRQPYDDWFSFDTNYELWYVNENFNRVLIGLVKIGRYGMGYGHASEVSDDVDAIRSPNLRGIFEALEPNFFSLGQDKNYYLNLEKYKIRKAVLRGLRDIAFDNEIFLECIKERVTQKSLLRQIERSTVENEFHRIANDLPPLDRYKFTYHLPQNRVYGTNVLNFHVIPHSLPPTNLHVIIGRNGVGKTTLLYEMANALLRGTHQSKSAGYFLSDLSDSQGEIFANVITVSFSAFDVFEPPSADPDKSEGISYAYVGLKKPRATLNSETTDSPAFSLMNDHELKEQLAHSLESCCYGKRRIRLGKMLKLLDTDPTMKECRSEVVRSLRKKRRDFRELANDLYEPLSSGHRIILLTMTTLVAVVAERSLILFDEPETHLHPPLIAAFIRALSELLNEMNGVALIATHSPVVLQEVPRSCVWKMDRSGSLIKFEKPDGETFGESVGTLTREAFDLDSTMSSGFHQILRKAARVNDSYTGALRSFNKQLGSEGRSILRTLVAQMQRESMIEDDDDVED